MTNLSSFGMNTEFMRYMKCASAFVNPNGITKYLEIIYSRESHLGYIFGLNLDLMIAGAKINLGEHLGSL
jgi:hypothetical protein